MARAQADGAVVILSTVFPAGDVPPQRRPFWSAAVDLAIVVVNAFLRTLAADNVLMFDSYALLADDEGGLANDFSRDELHLYSTGYDRLYEALGPLLATLVAARGVE